MTETERAATNSAAAEIIAAELASTKEFTRHQIAVLAFLEGRNHALAEVIAMRTQECESLKGGTAR